MTLHAFLWGDVNRWDILQAGMAELPKMAPRIVIYNNPIGKMGRRVTGRGIKKEFLSLPLCLPFAAITDS